MTSRHPFPTGRLVVGVVLAFAGVALLPLGSLADVRGMATTAAALTVAAVGLGVLLHVIVRATTGDPDR